MPTASSEHPDPAPRRKTAITDDTPTTTTWDAVPDPLRSAPQWVTWRYEPNPSKPKPDKIPYDPRTGRRASSTDPATWCTFNEAVASASGYDGVGFVVTSADPFVGLDLDRCVDHDTGVVASWAQQIVDVLDTYTEISPLEKGSESSPAAGCRWGVASETGSRCTRRGDT